MFVCGTQESFNAFLAQPGGRATGIVVLGRLLLSPRSFREGTYEAVLGNMTLDLKWLGADRITRA